jgi:putative FmdB family regulatory protein
MPTYDYKFEQCGFLFEASHSMSGSRDLYCPQCGSEAKKIITGGNGFIVKGSSTLYDTSSTKCGKEQTCCGKATPCEVRPCDK